MVKLKYVMMVGFMMATVLVLMIVALPDVQGQDGDYIMYMPIIAKSPPILKIEPIVRDPGSNEWSVSWTGGDAAVTEYVLEEAADAAFTTPTVYTATETFVDFDYGVSINQVFYYRVRADGSWGEGEWSDSVRVVGVYYFDDFSDPGSGWSVGSSSTSLFGYKSGQYFISVNSAGVLRRSAAPGISCDGYEVEVLANWASGSPTSGIYALVFGANNALDRFYFLAVRSSVQQYSVFLYDGGGVTNLSGWQNSSVITSGYGLNKLHIARFGNSIKVSINDKQIYTFNNGTLTGNTRVGVMTIPYVSGPYSEGRYDNFTVGACGLSSYAPNELMPLSPQTNTIETTISPGELDW